MSQLSNETADPPGFDNNRAPQDIQQYQAFKDLREYNSDNSKE